MALPTIAVIDAAGASQTISTLRTGRANATDSSGVALSNEDLAALRVSALTSVAADYEAVAASASNQALGATGAAGDYLAGVLIIPATTSPGAVSIKDGGGSAITIFTGGASSVSNLVPFFVSLGIASTGGAWSLTTGTNVSCLAAGEFS